MPATLLDSAVHIVASDEEEEDLRTLQHQDNLLMLLVLVITPYYLRTLYDYTLERFNALLQWISEHGYGIRCGENRRGHIGLGMLEVLQSRIPWREARTMTGMDKDTTLVAGFARLLLWHHLQPIAYGLAFVASWNDVSPLQRMLGAVVALREAIYLALTLICLHFNPAYLLVDTAATWRKDRYVALIFTLLYVLSPEKYVWFALVRGAAETGDASAVSAADPPYGRLPSEADEGDVVVAQQSAGAAAIEVSSSERPAALSGPAALAGRAGRVELEERSAAGAPMKITLDGARAGTVEFVAVAGRSWFRTIVLTNDSEDAQLFKVLTTAPTRYRVKPASGSLGAGCSVEVHLVLMPQDAVPNNLAQWAKDKFQIKNLAFPDEGASAEDIANAWKEAAPEAVQATRLRCSHHAPTGLAARTMPRQAPVAAPPAAPSPPPRAEPPPPPPPPPAAAVAGGSAEVELELEAKRLRDEQEVEVERIAATLHAAQSLGPRGAAILLFGGFLVLLDMVALIAMAVALDAAHRAPAPLLVGYSVTAVGGLFVLVCAVGYAIVMQIDKRGVPLPGPLAALYRQVRLVLLLAGVLSADAAAAAVAPAVAAAAIERPAQEALDAFWEKVGSSEEEVRSSTSLSWIMKHIDAGDARIVAYLLASPVTAVLKTLDLFCNDIGPEGGVPIGKALEVNKVLESLHLQTNKIGPESGVAIGKALAVNGVLKTLDLGSNNIGAEGANAIGGALEVNEALTTLDLRYNDIDSAGAKALFSALEGNAVLTSLDVGGNQIGPIGATAIAEALCVNGVLKTLNLSHNQLCGVDFMGRGTYSVVGITALAEALKVNEVLTSIDLCGNNLGNKGKKAIQGAVSGREGFRLLM